MLKKTLIASSILLASAVCSAEGMYIGASVGQTDFGVSGIDDGTTMILTGGYEFNQNYALEVSYVDLGEGEDDVAPIWTVDASGFNIAGVGTLPINETFDVFGKIGVFVWDLSIDEDGFGEIGSDDGTDLSLGVGIAANFTEKFGGVLEYQKFDLGGDDVNTLTIGAKLHF